VATVVGYQLNHNLHRIHGVFTGLADRPDRPTTGAAAAAMNILVLGTDRRSEVPTTGTGAEADAWVVGAQRTDTMMVLHLSGDRRSASVISIPRDSWVQIPGYGMDKINAAFSYGGLPLTIATVENLTGVHIDHLMLADWDGFASMTDILGGVRVTVPEKVTDSARGVTWTVGEHLLDGDEALEYVGQRYGLPLGDLDRVRRQQAVLRSLAAQTFDHGLWQHPATTYELLKTLTKHISVDDTWSLHDMTSTVMSLRGLHSSDIAYLTVPVRGFGREGSQSVVRLDQRAGSGLWGAVIADEVADWLRRHPATLTAQTVR
jgi:LCP family protein required for cell wall assembly